MVPKLLGVTPHRAAQDLGFYAYRLFVRCGRCIAHRRKALSPRFPAMHHAHTGCWKIRTANRESRISDFQRVRQL